MPTLRDLIPDIPGLRFIADELEILSGTGRRALFDTPFLTDAKSIEKELDDTEDLLGKDFTELGHSLMMIRDIAGTLQRLAQRQVLDDIELFEVKAFALLISAMAKEITRQNIHAVAFPDMEPIVTLLDPEGTRVAHFYIYDAYSPELKTLRNRHRANPSDALYDEMVQLEDKIRGDIARQLWPRASHLQQALRQAARLDLLIARAKLVNKLGLARPTIGGTEAFHGLFNPQIRAILKDKGRTYQPIDINIPHGVTVITGANMAGKSVTLKTVALAQAMAQLGFHVPAREAHITPVHQILMSIGDNQDENAGLSSFASEMLRIDEILDKTERNPQSLVLIDEPARTTNPIEGVALVNALVQMLGCRKAFTLVTTHYSRLEADANRLRVRGFVSEPSAKVTKDNIEQYIDYSLMPDDDRQAPLEALRIASILGISPTLIEHAKKYLSAPPNID